MVREWVLGGAVAALAVWPALARDDLKDPTKALAAETMLPCPSQGPGFARMPGSRTCFRISGRVVTGVDIRGGHDAGTAPMTAGRIAIDTRTDSDLGPVRTFVRIGQGRR